MDQEQRDRVLHFVERIGLYMEEAGLPRMAGRVLGWLLISDPPVQSSAQLVDALDASKGSISTNTRLLMGTGLIERVAMPGERGAYFRVRQSAWSQLLERKVTQIRHFRELCDEGLGLELGAVSRSNLRQVRDFYAFMEEEMPAMLEHWRQRNSEG